MTGITIEVSCSSAVVVATTAATPYAGFAKTATGGGAIETVIVLANKFSSDDLNCPLLHFLFTETVVGSYALSKPISYY